MRASPHSSLYIMRASPHSHHYSWSPNQNPLSWLPEGARLGLLQILSQPFLVSLGNTQLRKWKSLLTYTTGTLTDESLLVVVVVWNGQDGSQLSY